MATSERQRLIHSATAKARTEFVNYTVLQETEIYSIFKESADNIERQIMRFQKGGKIVPARLVGLQNNIKREMAALRPKLSRQIMSGMRNSVDYGMKSGVYSMNASLQGTRFKANVGSSYIGKDGKVRRYNPAVEGYKASQWATINGQAMDSLMRFSPDGLMLSERVWQISIEAQKSIMHQVRLGVATGASPADVARQIRTHLSQPEALYRRVKRNGKWVLSKAARAYKPGRGVYRSAYQNAMRVTRTEYARAYHEGIVRYANEKPFIHGYISRVTSNNPGPEDAKNDGVFFPKNTPPPIPYHPNCMCYAELVTDPDRVPKDEPMKAYAGDDGLEQYRPKGYGLNTYNQTMKLESQAGKDMLKATGTTKDQVHAHINEMRLSGKGKMSSKEKWFDVANNRYDSERLKLHHRIADQFLSTVKAAKPGEAKLLMTGGYPGSGKSTMLDHAFPGWKKKYVHLDSDAIKELLAAEDGIKKLQWRAALYHEEAENVINIVTQKAKLANKNVLFDGTMKNGPKMIKIVEDYQKLGYGVDVAFADLPLEKSMLRAVARSMGSSQRFVDPAYIATHGKENIKSLRGIRTHVDSWKQYSTDVPYGQKPILTGSGVKKHARSI